MKKVFLIIFLFLLVFASLYLTSFFSVSPSLEKPTTFVPRLVEKEKPFTPPPLTLERVFDSIPDKTATLSGEKIITLVATGDIGLVRSVNFQMVKKNDFTYPFIPTASLLKNADLTLINLEGPLIENCPLTNTGMVFCGDQRGVGGLVFAGVDIANLVNNHTLDQGEKGLDETAEVLAENKITSVRPGQITTRKVGEKTVAFLGFGSVNQPVDQEKIKDQVKKASSAADLVIVSFHWGNEYTPYPNKNQQKMAYLTIDNGADLIIGNHPHWIQPVEIYQGKLIVYAHGNFIFDQMWSQKTREGMVGKYVFYENKLIGVQFFPILINNTYQPSFLEGGSKRATLEDLREKSYTLSRKGD